MKHILTFILILGFSLAGFAQEQAVQRVRPNPAAANAIITGDTLDNGLLKWVQKPLTEALTEAGVTSGYTEYIALITQASTSAPTAKVIKNTTGATFTWAYVGVGDYTVTADTAVLTTDKTIFLTQTENSGLYAIDVEQTSTTVTQVDVRTASTGAAVNAVMEDAVFIIRVYE